MEDDDVSLNSTSVEEYSENEEFEVETIEAEKTQDGKKYYLLKWLGYQPSYNSWEPIDNIQDPDTIRQWEIKRDRQSRGLEPRFDLQRWEAMVENDAHQKAQRQKLREAKRQRLNMVAFKSESSTSDSDFDEAEEVEEETEQSGTNGKSIERTTEFKRTESIFRKASKISAPNRDAALEKEFNSVKPSEIPVKRSSETRKTSIFEQQRKAKDVGLQSTSSAAIPATTRSLPFKEGLVLKDFKIPKRANAGRIDNTARNKSKTATRGGSNLAGRDSRSLLSTSANPSQGMRLFKNARIRRKAELRTRALAEREPDLAALGGLYDPSKPEEWKRRRSEAQQSPNQIEEETLFIPDGTTKLTTVPGAFVAPPYLPSSKPVMDSSRATCFYWDRHQRNVNYPDCKANTRCSFLHRYESGIPIAPYPEPSYSSPGSEGNLQRLTCYFWDLSSRTKGVASCIKGEKCNFDHEHAPGKPVAPNPAQDRQESDYTERASIQHVPQTSNVPKSQAASRQVNATSTEADNMVCYEWFNGRPCLDRSTCKYRHSNNPGIPVASKPASSGVGAATQTPKAGTSLTSVIQEEPRISTSRNLIAQKGQNLWVPQSTWADKVIYDQADTFNATCYYWNRDGKCDKGEDCDYYHRYLNDVPIAPPSGPSRSAVCKHWEKGNCRYTADDRRYQHSFLDKPDHNSGKPPSPIRPREDHTVAIPVTRTSSDVRPNTESAFLHAREQDGDFQERQRDDRYSRRVRIQETCRFWARGHCYKSREDCEYIHDHMDNTQAVQRLDDDRRQSFAPSTFVNGRKKILRPCKFWLDGYCKYREEDCDYMHRSSMTDREEDINASSSRFNNSHFAAIPQPSASAAKTGRDEHDDMSASIPDSRNKDLRRPNLNRSSSAAESSLGAPESESLATPYLDDEHLSPISDKRLEPVSNNTSSNLGLQKDPMTKMSVAEYQTSKSMSLKDHRRRNSASFLASNLRELVIAPSQGTICPSFVVQFDDLSSLQDEKIRQDLSTTSRLRLDNLSMAHDVGMCFGRNDVLWTSPLRLATPDATNNSSLDRLAQELRVKVAGLSMSFPNFIFVVYPATAQWSFLGTIVSGSSGVASLLHMAILRGNIDVRRSKLKPLTAGKSIPEPALPRKALMKAIHGLEFKKLFCLMPPAKDTQKTIYYVFMMFPPHSSTESSLVSWLFASSKENVKVYSGQIEGSWTQFTKAVPINGLILLHESMIYELFRLPNIIMLLQKSSLIVRYVTDSGNLHPRYPSDSLAEDNRLLGQITETLILPLGHAFLLTPSLVVTEPHKVIEILHWFSGLKKERGKFGASLPGTWKIVTCHGFIDYVLEVAISKVEEKRDFEKMHRRKPSLEQDIEDRGLNFGMCKARYELHETLVELVARRFMKPCTEDIVDQHTSPIVYAPEEIDPDNEQLLVEWFASWAIQKMDKHRKFTVVGSRPEMTDRARRMIEVQDEEDAVQFTQTSVEDQVVRMISDEASKVTQQQPQPFRVTTSQSPFQGSPTFTPHVSFPAISPQISTPGTDAPMDLDSPSSSRRGSLQDDLSMEAPKPKSELLFEATPTWYERFQSNGGGYPHLLVAAWPQALENLGMGKGRK